MSCSKNNRVSQVGIDQTRVSIEGVRKLCIDFSNNQKLRYAKYHIYGQCKKLLKKLLKSEFITVKIVKNQLKI